MVNLSTGGFRSNRCFGDSTMSNEPTGIGSEAILAEMERRATRNATIFLALVSLGMVLLAVYLEVTKRPLVIGLSLFYILSSSIHTLDKRLLQLRKGAQFPNFPPIPATHEWKPALLFYWTTWATVITLAWHDWRWALAMCI